MHTPGTAEAAALATGRCIGRCHCHAPSSSSLSCRPNVFGGALSGPLQRLAHLVQLLKSNCSISAKRTTLSWVNPTRSRSRSVGRQLFAAHRAKHRHRQFPAVAQAPTAGHLQRQLGGRVKASSHASMPYAVGYTRCLTLTPGLKKAPASTPALPSRPRGHHGQLRPRRWARPGDRRRHP